MSDDERAARRERMQNMTPEEPRSRDAQTYGSP